MDDTLRLGCCDLRCFYDNRWQSNHVRNQPTIKDEIFLLRLLPFSEQTRTVVVVVAAEGVVVVVVSFPTLPSPPPVEVVVVLLVRPSKFLATCGFCFCWFGFFSAVTTTTPATPPAAAVQAFVVIPVDGGGGDSATTRWWSRDRCSVVTVTIPPPDEA